MSDRISPIERARYPNDLLSRVAELEAALQRLKSGNVGALSLDEISKDTWSLNSSFPSICQGRLTGTSGNPTPQSSGGSTLYFTPYIGNLIGLYNGSNWDQIIFSELSLPIQQSQTGTTHTNTTIDGLTDTSQLVVGMWVSGSGVPAAATIVSIDSATQITISNATTSSTTTSITFKAVWATNYDIFIINLGGGVLALRMIAWDTHPIAVESTITGVTNASPMVVTSGLAGSLPSASGAIVAIRNVLGATGANGVWRVGVVTGTTFQLLNFNGTNSAAGGVYTSGGTDIYVSSAGPVYTTRTSALALQDGVYVLASDPTWRYLGTIRTNTSNVLQDTTSQRFIWNYYNRIQRPLLINDSTTAWNVPVINTWGPDHNDVTNRVEFVNGQIENSVIAKKTVGVSVVNPGSGKSGILFDACVGAPTFNNTFNNTNAAAIIGQLVTGNVTLDMYLANQAGYHYIQGMEFGNSLTAIAFRGNGEHLIEAYVWS